MLGWMLVILACLWLLQGMLLQSPLLATLSFVGVIVATLILSVVVMRALTRAAPRAADARPGDR